MFDFLQPFFDWFSQLFDQVFLIGKTLLSELDSLVQLASAFTLILTRANLWFSAFPPIITTVGIITVSIAIFTRIIGRE